MTGVDQAVKRVMDALYALDAAVVRRLESERTHSTAADQAKAASSERIKLRSELDAVQARARQLEIANREAERHIGEAMTAIRTVISGNQN